MGPLKTGMSTLFIGLECVTDRQPVVIVIIRKKTDSCGNLPMVRPWKLPLKDKILISGQPGAYAKKRSKKY